MKIKPYKTILQKKLNLLMLKIYERERERVIERVCFVVHQRNKNLKH